MESNIDDHWPKQHLPSTSAIYVRNELKTTVSQAAVWGCLIAASQWPEWYENAANVRINGGKDSVLSPNVEFQWKTFGIRNTSFIREYEPASKIAWAANIYGLRVYHRWKLTPSEKGCYIVTEETQHGHLADFLKQRFPRLVNWQRKRMLYYHQLWIESLAIRAGA